jgi:nucleoredoxin
MPKKQILYFSATWCGPCNTFKQNEVPKFKDWKIGKDADSHIRIIDIDENQQLFSKYKGKVIPLFILFEDGKEIKRLEGYQSAKQISDLWYNK